MRIVFHGIISILLAQDLETSARLFIVGYLWSLLFFDDGIDLVRGKFNLWHFEGVCENWNGIFDWDCLWAKIDNYIPVIVFKFFIVAIGIAGAIWLKL